MVDALDFLEKEKYLTVNKFEMIFITLSDYDHHGSVYEIFDRVMIDKIYCSDYS